MGTTHRSPVCVASYWQVHGGFYCSYSSVRARLLEVVGTLMSDGQVAPWRISLTGHSTGAALATLCAFEMATSRSLPPSTFKCPL